jgi:hypothetical protein
VRAGQTRSLCMRICSIRLLRHDSD